MNHKVERIDNLMYKGCEPHWKCKYCGVCIPFHCFPKEEIEKRECPARAMEKLAAYEDTGFEPEDISSNIKTLSSELNNAFEELKVYRNLEEQGLLIKLPCKVGDTVYKLEDYGEWQDVPHVLIPIMCQVELIYLGDDNKVYCDLMSIDLLQDGAMFDEIPINEIYLSKEEAEKVLKNEENE